MPFGHRELLAGDVGYLQAHVIRARVEVLCDPLPDLCHVTPRHQLIHKPVTAAVAQLLVAEAHAPEVVEVVGQS